MKNWVTGFHQFRSEVFEEKRELFEKLGKGQSPQTAIMTCSDSRIDPALITQSDPGDIFVLRNAGNFIPRAGTPVGGEAATLQFAVEVLKVKELIICGHSQCGAVNHLIQPRTGPSHLTLVDNWIENSRATLAAMERKHSRLEGPERLKAAVRENVLTQIANARTYPFIEEAIRRGELTIYGWVYEFETGQILCCDHRDQTFVPVEQKFSVGSGNRKG